MPQPELPGWPQVDFASFGEVESKPLSRIQKLTGGYLTRNWTMIPHVTHNDEVDVTQLEKLKEELAARHAELRISPLMFLMKAAVGALRAFPQFNAPSMLLPRTSSTRSTFMWALPSILRWDCSSR